MEGSVRGGVAGKGAEEDTGDRAVGLEVGVDEKRGGDESGPGGSDGAEAEEGSGWEIGENVVADDVGQGLVNLTLNELDPVEEARAVGSPVADGAVAEVVGGKVGPVTTAIGGLVVVTAGAIDAVAISKIANIVVGGIGHGIDGGSLAGDFVVGVE